ncbi:HTTM domain-containing protein [Streptomyces sp. NPDC002187]|uniref:HTTM domain-containing protein n=1 Tax=Streptomyces sp. NPDC002187 TaxID=3364637 RepID=UPI0036825C19
MSTAADGTTTDQGTTTGSGTDRGSGRTETHKIARAVQRITSTALGPHQSAVVRIGFGVTWLLFLLRELPHRHELYGPEAPWSHAMAEQLIAGNDAFTVLLWSDGRLWFEFVYGISVLSSMLLMLGWHTRAVSAVFMVCVLSLQNRSIFVGDGGDNVIHLMAIYLVLTRCAQVWSLDARRIERSGGRSAAGRMGPVLWTVLGVLLFIGTVVGRVGGEWWLFALFWTLWTVQGVWWVVTRHAAGSEPRVFLDVLANLVHNAGLVLIMAEVCLIYATAGWYKIQGSRWQDGTALYYPLKLDYFTPWPALSDLLVASGVLVTLLTYGTVLAQVAFPFTLFNRRVKNVLLVGMMLEHAAIAVLLGLPFFSLAMIAADAVFLPTAFLLWLGGRVSRGRAGVLARVDVPRQLRRGSDDRHRTLVG